MYPDDNYIGINLEIEGESPEVSYEKKQTYRLDFSNLQREISRHTDPAPVLIPQGYINIPATSGADTKAILDLYKNFEKLNPAQLNDLINTTIDGILNYANPNSSKEEIEVIWKLFNNINFVIGLTNYLNNRPLSIEQIICCNRIIYDYSINLARNEEILQAMGVLAMTVNKSTVINLSRIQFADPLIAGRLAVCAYSTSNQNIGIKRLNLFMINSEDEVTFNESNIVHIYEELYWSCITVLTEGLMADVYQPEYLNQISLSSRNIYYIQNLALLDILEQMPSEALKQVLRTYTFGIRGNKVRFSIPQIDNRTYPRIVEVVKALAYYENVYVP